MKSVKKSLLSTLKDLLTASASDSRPKGVSQGDLELRAACARSVISYVKAGDDEAYGEIGRAHV